MRGATHKYIVTEQKINQMEIWFFDNRENRVGTLDEANDNGN